MLLDLIDYIDILYSRGNLVLLVITHFTDYVSQVFARSCFRNSRNDVAMFETCYRSDLLSDQIYNIFWYLFGVIFVEIFCFDSNECDWDFSFNLVCDSYSYRLGDKRMFHNNLFHLSSRQSMSCCIYNVIFSRHYIEITIFILISWITCIVMALNRTKVYLNIFVIVI
jgi:hypothetical protein